MGKADGKIALVLVPGAASGLGKEGAKVVVTTRKKLDEGRGVVE